jgi:hypothetical protein
MARPLRFGSLVVALLAWPLNARAEPASAEEQPEPEAPEASFDEGPSKKRPDEGARLLFALRPAAGNVGLADASFSGSGRPIDGGPREQVSFKGSEAGYASPFYVGGGVGAHALIEHVSLGLEFEFGWITESNAPRSSPDVTRKVDGASAAFWGGAFGLGGYVWLGPALLRGEVYAGARHFSMDLKGYEYKTCRTGRGREYPCPETVSSTQPLLQPRLSLDAVVARVPGSGSIVVGPWAGLEIVPTRSVSAGLSVGILFTP